MKRIKYRGIERNKFMTHCTVKWSREIKLLKMYLDHLHHHTLSFSFLLLPFFFTLSSPLFSFYLHLSLFLFFLPFLLLPFFLSLSLSSLHCFCYLSLCQFFFSSFLLSWQLSVEGCKIIWWKDSNWYCFALQRFPRHIWPWRRST